jgi:septal ring factor EnvC (AmiA/AmiB activator)
MNVKYFFYFFGVVIVFIAWKFNKKNIKVVKALLNMFMKMDTARLEQIDNKIKKIKEVKDISKEKSDKLKNDLSNLNTKKDEIKQNINDMSTMDTLSWANKRFGK